MPPVESRLNEAKAKTYVLFEGFVVDQVMLLMCCVQGNLESHQERFETWSLAWAMAKITCDLARQIEDAEKGLKKASNLEAEAQKELDAVNEKLNDIEKENEKNAIDHRTLGKYREELDELFEPIFVGQKYPTDEDAQLRLAELKEEKTAVDKEIEVTGRVLELLKTVDTSLMEGIIDLRTSGKTGSSGRIFFPDEAFNALKEARALLPELPSIVPPEKYFETADNTGAHYTPMQRYLWEVKDKVAALVPWCQERTLDNMRKSNSLELQIGSKTDERNLERRRLLRDVILSA
ncbi:unnamed protein product [Umbelopsis vinacea]